MRRPGVEPATPLEYTVLVTGTLKTPGPTSKAAHDNFAAGGREQAHALGDVAHDVFLSHGKGALAPDFMGIDRWTSLDGLQKFSTSPATAEVFGGLFTAPPAVSTWIPQPDWSGFGSSKDTGGGGAKYVLTVRGKLEVDVASARTTHNGLVAAGPPHAEVGNTAHLVFASVKDPSEILILEVWTSLEGQQKVYANPQLQQAIGGLFGKNGVAVTLFDTTDWAQW